MTDASEPRDRPVGQTSATPERARQEMTGPILSFDLTAELERIHQEATWRQNDRDAKTLLHDTDLHVVLVALKRGARLSEHQVAARIIIQAIQGQLNVGVSGQIVRLMPNAILTVAADLPHTVEAVEESAFLLTTGPLAKGH